MTQEAMDPLDVYWWWETFYNVDLGFVHLNPPFGHKVSKDDAFTDHEMTFFPIQYQVLFLASLQDPV